MAYTRTKDPVCGTGGLCDPGVIWAYVNDSSAATDSEIKVPWNSKFVYGYGVVTTVIASGAMAVKVEKGTAGGTELGTITFSSGDSLGQVRELVVAGGTAAANARDNIPGGTNLNLEVDGGGDATKGQANIYLYFEPIT